MQQQLVTYVYDHASASVHRKWLDQEHWRGSSRQVTGSRQGDCWKSWINDTRRTSTHTRPCRVLLTRVRLADIVGLGSSSLVLTTHHDPKLPCIELFKGIGNAENPTSGHRRIGLLIVGSDDSSRSKTSMY